jgi:hypothetical protein
MYVLSTYDLEFDLNNPHMLTEEEVWKLMKDISKDVEEATLVFKYLFIGS